ncbi:MAG: type IX secretion system membrane protein PorP/SprF [Flavobacterium sp.]
MKNLVDIILNKVNYTIVLVVFLLLCNTIVQAQKEAQYTQYMYNTTSINPAYAGSRDVFSLFGLYRAQWTGVDGAPATANLAFNTPVNDRIGLGVTIASDKIGPSEEADFSVDFSYNIPFENGYRFYFGIKSSANLLNVDFTKLNIYNPGNPSFTNNVDKQLSPNIGTGIYLQSDRSYLGVSVPYLLKTEHYKTSSNSVIRDDLPLYLMGGYVFDLSDDIQFKPAFLGTFVEDTPVKLDVSVNLLYAQKVMLGLSYRSNRALSMLTGFQVSDSFYLGYGYDFETNALSSSYGGTYEFFLRYEVFRNTNKIVRERFF